MSDDSDADDSEKRPVGFRVAARQRRSAAHLERDHLPEPQFR